MDPFSFRSATYASRCKSRGAIVSLGMLRKVFALSVVLSLTLRQVDNPSYKILDRERHGRCCDES
jgi:hypothetical protein